MNNKEPMLKKRTAAEKDRKYITAILAIVVVAAVFLAWQANLFWRVTGTFLYQDRVNENGIGLALEMEPAADVKEIYKDKLFSINDLRWYDCNNLSVKDKDEVLNAIPNINFNEDTFFTDEIKLEPDILLKQGKDPGLGVRTLHEQGITGKNVGIAIIDQELYAGHPEYASRIKSYEGMHFIPGETASMHGAAVSSIAVGKNCGVAPDADLYYWANINVVNYLKPSCNENDIDWTGYARIIDRIIEVNKALPDDKKIRVISISRGYRFSNNIFTNKRLKKMLAAIQRAENAGIFVVTTATELNYDFLDSNTHAIGGLGKINPAGDPDDVANYTLGSWEWNAVHSFENALLVPMDHRTTADMSGGTYAFYADGGLSWTCPYVAGLYALCAQVYPDITPEVFFTNAMETSTEIVRTSYTGEAYTFHVVNPQKLVEQFMDK